jgi:hypothetical protein
MVCIASLRYHIFYIRSIDLVHHPSINDLCQRPSVGACEYITCRLETFFSNPLAHFNVTGRWIVGVASPSLSIR